MTPDSPKAWGLKLSWICPHCNETHNHDLDLWDLDVFTTTSHGIYEETHVEIDLQCMNPGCLMPVRISR